MDYQNYDKNNVLFIGNGLDRLAGYDTDYISFLEYYSRHYKEAVRRKIVSEIEKKSIQYRDISIKVDCDTVTKYIIEGKNSKLADKTKLFEIVPNYENPGVLVANETNPENIKEEILSNLGLCDPSLLVSDEAKDEVVTDRPNAWIVYFQYLYLYSIENNIKSNYLWTDLEYVIYQNCRAQNTNEETSLPLMYTELMSKIGRENDDRMTNDFFEMKELLAKFIDFKKKDNNNGLSITDTKVMKYGTYLNFNYSETNVFSNDGKVDEFFIHGNVTDNENIVFGYDDGMLIEKNIELRSENTRRGLYQYLTDEHMKLSKTSQLLNLTTYHQSDKVENNIILPKQEEIKYIGILGHGIGQADYNYFETFCNFDNVKIEVFWYEYCYTDKDGEKKDADNKMELQEKLIKMLQEMEKRQDRVFLHKMLIEQRIVFSKLDYS